MSDPKPTYRGYRRRGALPPALVDGRTFRLLEDTNDT